LTTEAGTSVQLALACATLVGLVAVVWQRDGRLSVTLLVAITSAMTASGIAGAIIPRVLYAIRRNPNVAAGPTVLAVADFVSLVVYFSVATHSYKHL
jgi:magnesium transporter